MATAAGVDEMKDEAVSVQGFRPYRMTAEQYHRLVESGVFDRKDRVFLWDGRLVEKMTIGRRHTIALTRLQRLLDRLLPGGYSLEQEQPMDLGGSSVPEPDLKVVRGALEDYPDRPPTARDVPLVVEVADSSLPMDSGVVLRAYAEADIAVYWVVNLPGNRIDVYSGPGRAAGTPCYQEHRAFGPEDAVPVVLDGREVGRVRAGDVLP